MQKVKVTDQLLQSIERKRTDKDGRSLYLAVKAVVDSEILHRCCHLPNNVENIGYSPYFAYFAKGREMSPKLSLPLGESELPLDPPDSTAKWLLDRFSHFSTAHDCD